MSSLATVDRRVGWLFASGVFTSAFLLFQVQPLVGRMLLPHFGGTSAVWTTCLMFFQMSLWLGYLCAHLGAKHLSLLAQLSLAFALAIGAAARLPFDVTSLPVASSASPRLSVLLWLASQLLLPFTLLSMSAPLLQRALHLEHHSEPYRLYAVSNAGSLLALASYPLLFEPFIAVSTQNHIWRALFLVYCCILLAVTWSVRHHTSRPAPEVRAPRETRPSPLRRTRLLWLALSLVPTLLLLAISSHVTQDVAAGPLLWVLPLGLYLLSFVIVFAFPAAFAWQQRWLLFAWVGCTAVLGMNLFVGARTALWTELGASFATLFVGCLLCHGELLRRRPPTADLTAFYLWLATGGALGGLLGGLIAPLVFDGYFELQTAVLATFVLMWIVTHEEGRPGQAGARRLIYLGTGVALPLMLATVYAQTREQWRSGQVLSRTRSFFGLVQVTRFAETTVLTHGRIRHGMQFNSPLRRSEPNMYFGKRSGVGAVLLHQGERRRIGVLGLGVGTLAAYGRQGDTMVFFELNPDVVSAARTDFTFLSDSAANIEIVEADGRLALREYSAPFDVLVLDAFSSDAVPMHLLTREAFALYTQRLNEDGILVANVSNRFLDVERAVAGAAATQGLLLDLVETPGDHAQGLTTVRWALMARKRQLLDKFLGDLPVRPLAGPPVIWDDGRGSVLSILRERTSPPPTR